MTTPQEASRAAFEAPTDEQLWDLHYDLRCRMVAYAIESDEFNQIARAVWQAATAARDTEIQALRDALHKVKLSSWTDTENYGEKFCDAFNAGVSACIEALKEPK